MLRAKALELFRQKDLPLYRAYVSVGQNVRAIADKLKISTPTAYKRINEPQGNYLAAFSHSISEIPFEI